MKNSRLRLIEEKMSLGKFRNPSVSVPGAQRERQGQDEAGEGRSSDSSEQQEAKGLLKSGLL